ncbi:MAG: DNA recombination/repair protein RecA, partial [Clostridia bacterium]|nr:DNA recombination/repair protein RecA [Clostridia bacterium]
GRALKFSASVRIDVRRIESLKENGELIGSRTRAKIVKNKVAPPFKEAEFDIMYGKGVSHEGEVVDIGVKTGILVRSGAWFYYGDTRLGQGRDNVKKLFTENKALCEEIENKIIAYYDAEKNKKNEPKDDEPVIIPEQADIEARPRKRVNIDIAVDD